MEYPTIGIRIGMSSPKAFRQLSVLLFIVISHSISAQFDNNGCLAANFGIDAGLYSEVIEYGDANPAAGSIDWFMGATGQGVIEEGNTATIMSLLQTQSNPTYEARMIEDLSSIVGFQIYVDAIFAKDYHGGSGQIDISTFETASKNGEDPAIWDAGEGNVLGKNDLIDVSGFMFRNGTELINGTPSDLWFVGMINRAEPGGSAYMDFEFFVEDIKFNSNPQSGDAGEGNFDSGGPDLGHTAFQFNQSTGEITEVGDFIFNTSLINGGNDPDVELRLWVSRADYQNITPLTFNWGPEFDGPFTGSPYGYASVIPLTEDACGIVNQAGETPAAPPWGTRGTSSNVYGTTYQEYSVVELGINMSAFGLDHASLSGTDPCVFPINTFLVKTRASASFTAQLKDYAGPFTWANPATEVVIVGEDNISCENPVVRLEADPYRQDASYSWSTPDGSIISDPNLGHIYVDKPGTYLLDAVLPIGCPIDQAQKTVEFDPTKPFFQSVSGTTTVACNGNDGTIDLSVSGATPPYSYQWYNVNDPNTVIATTQDISGLSPGQYYAIIEDQIPCSISSDTFTISAKTPTAISFSNTDIACFGENSGSIDVTATGRAPYNYSWSTGSTLEDITGLTAGNYSITVTDMDGCEESSSTTLTQPTLLQATITATTDETDPSANDGTIDLSVNGGTSPYTFDWDYNGLQDPDTDPEDLNGLSAGTYEVTVTDNNGCTTTAIATIYEPEICDDGIDNDGDGLADCDDDDCLPPNPGVITPSENPVCVGDTGITYSIADIGADSYTWTVPTGASITNGQGSLSITVSWINNQGGDICVIAISDAGCESAMNSCLTVIPEDVPPQPGAIIIQGN